MPASSSEILLLPSVQLSLEYLGGAIGLVFLLKAIKTKSGKQRILFVVLGILLVLVGLQMPNICTWMAGGSQEDLYR